MPESEPWTIGRLLVWTTDYLKQHGSESPRLDAEVLLAHAKGASRIELYTAFGDVASDDVRQNFRDLVRRRSEGTPVAYLVGHKEFYSLDFRVTPDVLIPRPETESIVVTLLDLIKQRGAASEPIRVADVGTGSGIIAVCAARLSACQVTAIDISPAAVRIAAANAAQHGVSDRIEFVQSDLFAAVAPDRRFDYIASNPPYVSSAEMAALPASVKNHEPHLALSAGSTGVAMIERLIPQAAERLSPGGAVLIEVSPMLEQSVRELITKDDRLVLGPTIKDLAGLPRVVCATRSP